MSRAVAKQYARALLEVAEKPAAGVIPEDVPAQLAAFEQALGESAELRSILLSPALAPAAKEKVIGRLCTTLKLSQAVQRFLGVAVKRRRLALLGEMREAYQTLLDERAGLTRAEVASAMPLSGEQKEQLTGALSRLAGRTVRCEFRVDPALLGGVSARLGAKVYDGSILGKMAALERRMSSAG
jgi:F-type H+-transporting ATPase subunit delta